MRIGRINQPRSNGWRACFALAILFAFGRPDGVSAQSTWTTSGNNINNTNPGNVGVGTAAPEQVLHAHGTEILSTGFQSGFKFRDRAGGATDNWVWYSTGNIARLHRQGVGDFLSVNTSGYFGFGTTNPVARAHFSLGSAGTAPALYPTLHDVLVLEANPSPIMQFLMGSGGEGWVEWSRGGASPLRGVAGIGYTSADNTMHFVTANDGSFANQFRRMVINGAGNVGIGTTAPAHRLDVAGNVNGTSLCIKGACKSDWSQVGGTGGGSQWTTSGTSVFYGAGHVGVGTSTPGARLDVGAGAAPRGGHSDVLVGTGGDNAQLELFGPTKSSALTNDEAGGGLVFYTNGPAWSPSLFVAHAGNVGVGTTTPAARLHVEGDLKVTGNISAKYQDVAEWVPSTQRLAAGTVVVLDKSASNHVIASSRAYDTKVAGVISLQPGIALGEAGEGKLLVATTGRVRVKVDATRGPIEVGDLLVTGDTPGMAMLSEPVTVGGRQLHAPGTIIGKALEPLAKGTGEILVLLSLQ